MRRAWSACLPILKIQSADYDRAMCGRFTIQHTWVEFYEALNLIPASAKGRNDPPRYNVTPTQQVGFIHEQDGETVVKDGRWGLVPFWVKEKMKQVLINARSETVADKPSFKHSYKSKRCLIPASSYYEWTGPEHKVKLPHNIHLPDYEPFFFAGLWAHNNNLKETSCTILTCEAHPAIRHLHDRMPIILEEAAWKDWISSDVDSDGAKELILQNRGSGLVSYRVDPAVNKRDAQGSHLIDPI